MTSLASTYRFERLENKPILLFQFSGVVNMDALNRAFTDVVPLMEAIVASGNHTLYNILDIREVTVSFVDIMQILKAGENIGPQVPGVEEFELFMVGGGAMAKLYVDGARQQQFGSATIPMFAIPEDAIAAVEKVVASRM